MNIQDIINDADFFAHSALFERVAPKSIEHYIEECSMLDIAAGDVLLAPDTDNRQLYVIVSGCLEVRLKSLDRTPLTTLTRGECTGEMSIIEGRTPSAYVIATADSSVLEIPRDVLWAMVGASHAIARNLLVILSGRLRTDNAIIADSSVVIRHFQKKSYTDELTGLHNRRWMDEFFAREISRGQMSHEALVLAVLDIDHFRDFNNRFGHLVGDHALGAVTEALTAHFRSNDLIARYGGDEFVVLLPRTALSEARQLTGRVKDAMVHASKSLNSSVPKSQAITVSIGIAEMTADDSLATLIAKADAALYRSKEKGRNRVSD